MVSAPTSSRSVGRPSIAGMTRGCPRTANVVAGVHLHQPRILAVASLGRFDQQPARGRAEVADERRERVLTHRHGPEQQQRGGKHHRDERRGDRAAADDDPVPVVDAAAEDAAPRLRLLGARCARSRPAGESEHGRHGGLDRAPPRAAARRARAVLDLGVGTASHSSRGAATREASPRRPSSPSTNAFELRMHGLARDRFHFAPSASRRFSRALARRDLTVPTATPSDAAISS